MIFLGATAKKMLKKLWIFSFNFKAVCGNCCHLPCTRICRLSSFSLSIWFPASSYLFLFVHTSSDFTLFITACHLPLYFFFLRNCSSGIGELLWFQDPCSQHLVCLRYPFPILFRMQCHYLILGTADRMVKNRGLPNSYCSHSVFTLDVKKSQH